MGDTGKISDKGKSPTTSEQKSFDSVRVAAQQQRKREIELDPQREKLRGGSGEGSSKQQGETTRQQESTKKTQCTTEGPRMDNFRNYIDGNITYKEWGKNQRKFETESAKERSYTGQRTFKELLKEAQEKKTS